MKKERYFALKRPFKHPYITYEVGTNYSARMWADILGHGMKEKEFIDLVEKAHIDKIKISVYTCTMVCDLS
jgi:hypothetical protein